MFKTANCEKQMKPILSGIYFKLCLNCKGCPTCVSNCVKTSHISDPNCHRLAPVFCLKPHLMGMKKQMVKSVFLDMVLSQFQKLNKNGKQVRCRIMSVLNFLISEFSDQRDHPLIEADRAFK